MLEKPLKSFPQCRIISVLPGSKANAEYILSLYKKWGWDAQIETFHVLFPTPKTRVLEMISPTSYKAILKEPALKEDANKRTGRTVANLQCI